MSLLRKAGGKSKAQPIPDFPSAAAAATTSADLFTDAHAPKSSQDLAVHKKKVDEVRDWLKRADVSLQLGLPPTPRLLVLSGPPGAGKSAVLRVLAEELGFETCEWLEPRALSWDDADGEPRPPPYDGGGGGRSSTNSAANHPRVAAFATFLRDSLRTLSLCVGPASGGGGGASAAGSSSGGSRRRLVVLDELLPPTGEQSGKGKDDARDAQIALIRRALPTARFPLALVLSTDASNTVHHLVEQLKGDASSHSLVSEIKVNAVADTFLSKALKDVCAKERLELTQSDLASLVTTANGDLRHALHALQFLAAGVPRRGGAAKPAAKKGGKRALGADKAAGAGGDGKGGAGAASSRAMPDAAERDKFPDMFRAIGSILHRPAKRVKLLAEEPNKQHSAAQQEQRPPQRYNGHGRFGISFGDDDWLDGGGDNSSTTGSGGSATSQPNDQKPHTLLTVDPDFEPERVIESSALEEPSAAAFLHQNYVECFSSMDDLAEAANYFSDAHVLTDAQKRRPWQLPLLPYIASIAGRGVVTTNVNPAPSKFLQTRKPQLFQVERDGLERKRRAVNAFHSASEAMRLHGALGGAFGSGNGGGNGGMGIVECGVMHGATSLTIEILPALKLIATPQGVEQQRLFLTHEQWQSMAEIVSYNGGPPPPPHYHPTYAPPPPPAGAPMQQPAGGTSANWAADEIED